MLTQYQVGGSLHNNDPTYVVRSSDHQLYNALKAGEFCYVFNSRQMGKSSLLVRTKHQLETEGYCCAVVDMTQIGSQDTTPIQWYKGMMMDLLRGFGCFGQLNFKTWWQEQEGISLVQNSSTLWIKKIVRSQIIEKWESQDEPEHLRTIRDRLIHNSKNAGRLLGVYQKILQGTEVKANDSREQIELFLSGLIIKSQGYLKVRNLIYQEVFNLGWVQQQLAQLRPYSQTFDAWIASGQQDESRLLRGQALKDSQNWALGKSLSDLDYQFLAASQDCDRQEVQLALEAERAKAIEAKLVEQQKRLIQEKNSTQHQRILLVLVSFALVLVGILSIAVHQQYQLAKISEIQALASSSKGLFASNQKFDALLEAIRSQQKLKQLENVDITTQNQVNSALRRAVYGVEEYNRLSGHKSGILDLTG